MNATICETCGERPISAEAAENGYNCCEDCSRTTGCNRCFSGICEDPHFIWETSEKEEWLCSKCARDDDRDRWLNTTEEKITSAACEVGWEIIRTRSGISEAIYLILRDPDDVRDSLKIRIADHPAGKSLCSSHGECDYSIERTLSETTCNLENVLEAISHRQE